MAGSKCFFVAKNQGIIILFKQSAVVFYDFTAQTASATEEQSRL